MQEITKDFSVKHATVTYPDDSTEDVEYVQCVTIDNVTRLTDVSDDAWRAYRAYHAYGKEPRLRFETLPENVRNFSVYNYQDIEVNWVEELVAVAEVEVVEDRTTRRFWFDRVDHEVEPQEPDVDVWERLEWESFNE